MEAVRAGATGSLMKTIRAVVMVCSLALSLGWLGMAKARQGGSSAPAHPAGSAAGSAQTGGGTGSMSADTPEDDAALNLTDEQKEKIKAIRDDAQQQIKAMKKDSSLSDEAKQQKMKVIRKDIRRQVWGVMTPEQQKQWAAEQRELRESTHGGSVGAASKPQN